MRCCGCVVSRHGVDSGAGKGAVVRNRRRSGAWQLRLGGHTRSDRKNRAGKRKSKWSGFVKLRRRSTVGLIMSTLSWVGRMNSTISHANTCA